LFVEVSVLLHIICAAKAGKQSVQIWLGRPVVKHKLGFLRFDWMMFDATVGYGLVTLVFLHSYSLQAAINKTATSRPFLSFVTAPYLNKWPMLHLPDALNIALVALPGLFTLVVLFSSFVSWRRETVRSMVRGFRGPFFLVSGLGLDLGVIGEVDPLAGLKSQQAGWVGNIFLTPIAALALLSVGVGLLLLANDLCNRFQRRQPPKAEADHAS